MLKNLLSATKKKKFFPDSSLIDKMVDTFRVRLTNRKKAVLFVELKKVLEL